MDERGDKKIYMKIKDKIYDKKIVIKPWGYEYVAYRNKNKLAITFLNINYKKKTSLHCHPNKKTGFILLDGVAEIQLGLWRSKTKKFKSPSKLMIRKALFHSIKAVSKNGIKALEFETPVKKNDLVRYEDSYGRKAKPYEGNKFIKKLYKKDILFQEPKVGKPQNYKVDHSKVSLEVHKNFKTIVSKKMSTIFAVIDGSIVDKQNRNICSKGDIVKTGTFKKLAKNFKIKKQLTLLSVN
jgi:mannose-6-phosphate isomerase-like protein (cupin superfamily)